MKNSDLINNFVRGSTSGKTKSIFIEENIIYSYGYHFPLAVRLKDGFIVNSSKYSNTTSHHTGLIKRSVFGQVIFIDCNRLRDILRLIPFNATATIEEVKNLIAVNNL